MRTDTRLAVLAALGCGALATSGQAPAADAVWNGSYAADGACHCIGDIAPDVAAIEVDTPLGRRSVERVCEALGEGPGLQLEGGEWNRTVYPDSQCGNGPFASGVELLDPDCAGTRRSGEADCRPVGPTWDLGSAFAAAPDGESADGSPAPPPADASLASAPGTVEIDGRRWRRAPDGTPRSGGRPGSRIILDGELWLRADDPRFAYLDAEAERARRAELRAAAAAREIEYTDAAVPAPADTPTPRRAASTAAPAVEPVASGDRVWREAPVEPDAESPEAFRARQRELVAASRRREAAERPADEPVARSPAPETPSDPAAADEAPLAAALPAEPGAEAVAETDPAVRSSAEAVAATDPGADEPAAPLAALRLPANVRGSSDEFAYVEALPKSYEIGGAGIGLEASAETARRFHFLARVGAARSYREVALGAGVHVTPAEADRLTFALTGGVEYGTFELVGTDGNGDPVQTLDDGEAGLFVAVSSRLVVNPRFELSGGVGYSSFHEGDPHGFGGAHFHINRQFDLTSRFEVGDNDQLGIGLRYYY